MADDDFGRQLAVATELHQFGYETQDMSLPHVDAQALVGGIVDRKPWMKPA